MWHLTDVEEPQSHLPRRIADALHHAYKGELDIHYDEEGYFVRVNWKREP